MLTIPVTQMPESQVLQTAQQTQVVPRGQQPPRCSQTSYLIVNEQQSRTLRQLHFTIRTSQSFSPLSEASVSGEESSHNILGLSSLFGNRVSHELSANVYTLTSPPTTQQQEPPQQPVLPQPPTGQPLIQTDLQILTFRVGHLKLFEVIDIILGLVLIGKFFAKLLEIYWEFFGKFCGTLV